jgi:Putative transposase/Transposase zinc-binding domain
VAAPGGRPPELAEIFRAHAPAPEQLGRDRGRVVRDVVQCRTPLLGGHMQVCDHCGREKPFYNSCRNRHCPKCQSLEQTRWVEAQTRSLLPVPYFHLVFTVPPALHPFFLAEKRGSYAFLFEAALQTLHAVCQRRLGATPGTIAVLHTWSQTLAFHPHVHCIVTGGGLNAARDHWIAARPAFLVPVRVLSRVFRGKLLEAFEHALTARTAGIGSSFGRRLLQQASAKDWVVYSKAPMAGPAQVLRYLGRYTHRIAIGNERLVALQDGRVTFRYRDRRHGNQQKLLTLDASDFVQRFLLHVLPHGFVRVRHFGLQANGCRTRLLTQARRLLGSPAPSSPDSTLRESWQDLFRRLTGRDPSLCPYCQRGTLRVVASASPPQHTRGP